MMLMLTVFLVVVHNVGANKTLEAKVVGFQTEISLYPHAVFMLVKRHHGDYICGASILNQKILLTAAHCIEKPYKSVAIFAGHTANDLGQRYPVREVVPHEMYNVRTVDYDIGLVLVAKPIKLGPMVQKVAIGHYPIESDTAAVAGWGLVDEENQISSKYLHYAKLKVWSYERCRTFMSTLPRGCICAGDFEGKTYAAPGDSGSGLIAEGYILIGVVSYKGQDLRSIVAFTDPSYYFLWIRDTAKRLFCDY